MGYPLDILVLSGLMKDPLIFLLKATGVYFFSSVFWKSCLLVLVVYLQILTFASFPVILYGNFNYIPCTALIQTSIVYSFVVIGMAPEMIRVSKVLEQEAYCLKNAGEKVYQKIDKECKIIKILCYSSTVMMEFIVIIDLPFLGDEHHWQYHLFFIKEHVHYFQWGSYVLLYISINICTLCVTSAMSRIMYNAGHILFQVHILNQSVIRLATGMTFSLHDVRYQERVRKQLTRCVRMQSNIIRIINSLTMYAGPIGLGMSVGAAVTFVSATFFVSTGVSPRSNFRMYLILVPWFLQLCLYCLYYQQISNESHSIFKNSLRFPWYNWNTRNRKTYLLFLTGNTNELKISIYKWMDVDSTLILKICRLSYSILALLLQIKKKTSS